MSTMHILLSFCYCFYLSHFVLAYSFSPLYICDKDNVHVCLNTEPTPNDQHVGLLHKMFQNVSGRKIDCASFRHLQYCCCANWQAWLSYE